MNRRLVLVLVLALAGGLVACGDDDSAAGTGADVEDGKIASGGGAAALEGTVVVAAAASLTDAFGDLAAAFEAAHDGVTVELTFAGSSSLREQILDGAPVDVFASADAPNMSAVVAAGSATDPAPFVTNRLAIAVPPGNPAGVAGLDAFADPGLLIGLCAEEVPCGHLGREVLANAGITPSLDTDEPHVRALLTRIEEDELDAGIVYRSDVISAGDAIEGIEIPEDVNVITSYPIASLVESRNPSAGTAFVAFVLSAEGQAILTSHGFSPA